MSWLVELATQMLILGFSLGEADNSISAPDEETVMVGTAPLVTMWGRWPYYQWRSFFVIFVHCGGRSMRLGQKEVERSMSDDCDIKDSCRALLVSMVVLSWNQSYIL